MQPQEPVINDPGMPDPNQEIIGDPDIPVDAPVDDVYESGIQEPDVVD